VAALFAFIGIWLISLVVAMLAALQLGDFFMANQEFPLIIAAIVAFDTAAMVLFGVGYALARHLRILHGVALVLVLCALAPVVLPGFVQKIADRSTNPYTVGIENTYITLELVIPALLAVLVQWGLVRRRWLRATGADDLTLWPWVTTVIAGLMVLNPFGLAIVGATLRHSGSDWFWEIWATVTAGATLVLVVMALVECYIRRRILRRRLTPAGVTLQATANGEASG
jgi:hypothetical protein